MIIRFKSVRLPHQAGALDFSEPKTPFHSRLSSWRMLSKVVDGMRRGNISLARHKHTWDGYTRDAWQYVPHITWYMPAEAGVSTCAKH